MLPGSSVFGTCAGGDADLAGGIGDADSRSLGGVRPLLRGACGEREGSRSEEGGGEEGGAGCRRGHVGRTRSGRVLPALLPVRRIEDGECACVV